MEDWNRATSSADSRFKYATIKAQFNKNGHDVNDDKRSWLNIGRTLQMWNQKQNVLTNLPAGRSNQTSISVNGHEGRVV